MNDCKNMSELQDIIDNLASVFVTGRIDDVRITESTLGWSVSVHIIPNDKRKAKWTATETGDTRQLAIDKMLSDAHYWQKVFEG